LHGLIGLVGREVDAGPAREQRELAGLIDMPGIVFEDVFGLCTGRRHDHGGSGKQLDVVGIAAEFFCRASDFAGGARQDRFGLAVEKDRFRMPGGKGAATLRGSRLIQQRRSLRRRFGEVDAVDTIMASPVPDRMNLCRIGKDARVAIAADRIVLPAAFP
jgi:hypothetical protein